MDEADIVEAFAACVVDGDGGCSAAAAEHSECAVCFDELHSRTLGVLLDERGRRLCRHIFHLDCLQDLPSGRDNGGKPLCPVCRRQSSSITKLPSLFDDPKRWFELVDADRCGEIEADDVLATLKAQLPVDEESIDQRWDGMWAHLDADGSGKMSFAELVNPENGLVAFLEKAGLGKNAAPTKASQPDRPPCPDLATDPGGWFDHWDDDGEGHMGEGDVLRALVHSLEIRGDRSQIQGTADLALLRRGYSVDESPRLWIFPC